MSYQCNKLALNQVKSSLQTVPYYTLLACFYGILIISGCPLQNLQSVKITRCRVMMNELKNNHTSRSSYIESRLFPDNHDMSCSLSQADDDTYVIMENLRYFLSIHDPTQPIYFGSLFKVYVRQGYMRYVYDQ